MYIKEFKQLESVAFQMNLWFHKIKLINLK